MESANQIPQWMSFVGSGAFFIFLFGIMAKWIMNGFKETLKDHTSKIEELMSSFHNLDKQIIRHEHLPEKVEKLTDRIRDTESSTEAAWGFLKRKYPGEIRESYKET